jgi:hypothetical protein
MADTAVGPAETGYRAGHIKRLRPGLASFPSYCKLLRNLGTRRALFARQGDDDRLLGTSPKQ